MKNDLEELSALNKIVNVEVRDKILDFQQHYYKTMYRGCMIDEEFLHNSKPVPYRHDAISWTTNRDYALLYSDVGIKEFSKKYVKVLFVVPEIFACRLERLTRNEEDKDEYLTYNQDVIIDSYALTERDGEDFYICHCHLV